MFETAEAAFIDSNARFDSSQWDGSDKGVDLTGTDTEIGDSNFSHKEQLSQSSEDLMRMDGGSKVGAVKFDASSLEEISNERGLAPDELDSWIVDLDTDLHRAITESGWWERRLFEEISRREKLKGGLLNQAETIKVAQDLLDEIGGWWR